ncbi:MULTISPECIES: hypothetical protein [unclassified Endozoicomonas]|uniref:hypothetical protein n=1 Tax=unclassified Endozoicomonas TaxID=2644528 RepID=UPI00214793A9|nr:MULTISPECIES: hypothetical protein [unclassified Endozoicomonas]
MYKLMAIILVALVAIVGLSRHFEMSIGQDYAYVKADYPRFADKAWFDFEVGKRGGLEGVYDNVKEKIKQ